MVPRVTMNGLIFNCVVSRPLSRPQRQPAKTPTSTPSQMGPPCCITMAPSMLLKARTAPTLKSMPPATMIIVMPSAMMLMTAV